MSSSTPVPPPAPSTSDRAPGAHQAPSVAHEQKRPPSGVAFGGTLVGSILLMATILLTYTLVDWEWQQNIGWWNYVAAAALIPVATYVGVRWQPDETL